MKAGASRENRESIAWPIGLGGMQNKTLTSHDLLTHVAAAVRSGQPADAALQQLKTKADWDTLQTPKARLSQVQTWCATIKPDLPKPLYKKLKHALRAAALPAQEAASSTVKFKINGTEVQLEREHVEARGGVLANYAGPFAESAFGTHSLQLGFHLTAEQLVGMANYISEGELPEYTSPQLRKELCHLGDRLGMEGLVASARAEGDAQVRAQQQTLRRDTLMDLGVAISSTVDAAWQEASKHLRLPNNKILQAVSPLSAWGRDVSRETMRAMRSLLDRPHASITVPQEPSSLPVQLGWLHGLVDLSLANSRVATLPTSLTGLVALQSLNLSGSLLSTLPGFIFELPQLTRLEAQHLSQLTHVEPFDPRAAQLQQVALGGSYTPNALTLPDCLFDLPQLASLTVNNVLASMPPAVSRASHLETLNWKTGLAQLPAEIGALTALQTLNIAGNALTALPPQFGALGTLQTLNVESNALTALPPQISGLTALTSLRAWDNQLTALPPEVGGLTRLQQAVLRQNRIAVLPDTLGNLTQLSSLDLSHNALANLPNGLSGATALQSLQLGQNVMRTVPPAVTILPQLITLDMSQNRLEQLPQGWASATLQTLSLGFNQLTEMPKRAWIMPALTSLELSENRLTKLPSWMTQLTALRLLSPHGRQRVSIPSALQNMAGLRIDAYYA